MHNQVFLGLGSNLGDSTTMIKEAIHTVVADEKNHFVAQSSMYTSTPMGPQDQPDYINAVCQISTEYSPHELLKHCQSVENDFGRERAPAERWGPRTLDIDILLFDGQAIQTTDLTIPHIGMAEREFVLVPLFEIAPTMVMPDGQPLAKWVSACDLDGLKRLR